MNANTAHTQKICVIGGTGFVGTALCRQLLAKGHTVTVLSRNAPPQALAQVNYQQIDLYNIDVLKKSFQGQDAIIFLSGILHEKKSGDFDHVHFDLPRLIIEACQACGIQRYLHMSALGARVDAPSAYLRSKGKAEQIVQQSGLDYTIFRPSVIFGKGDSFLTLFAQLLKYLPVVLLASPDARFQPVYVENVATAFVTSLENTTTLHQTYDLGGNKIYTLKELIEYISILTKRARLIIGLNPTLSYYQAWLMECLPVKLMTRDNFYSMQVENTCNINGLNLLQIPIVDLETIAPSYL